MRPVLLTSVILACTWTSAMGADNSSKTFYLQCEALPVQVGEKFPGHVLRRGDSVTIRRGGSSNLNLEFLLDGKKVQSPVPENVLTQLMALKMLGDAKPPAAAAPQPSANAAEPPAPAVERPADESRLQGTWLVVNYSVCGKLNPGPGVAVDVPDEVLSSLIPGFPPEVNVEMFRLGQPVARQPVAQNGNKIPAAMLQPNALLYTFAGKKMTAWSFIPMIDEHDKLTNQPQAVSLYNEFQLNAEVAPKQIDMVYRELNDLISQTGGIYTFDGELLKVALPATLMGAIPLMEPPAELRPASFEAAAAKRAVVCWLMRVEGPNVPEPPKLNINNETAPGIPGTGIF